MVNSLTRPAGLAADEAAPTQTTAACLPLPHQRLSGGNRPSGARSASHQRTVQCRGALRQAGRRHQAPPDDFDASGNARARPSARHATRHAPDRPELIRSASSAPSSHRWAGSSPYRYPRKAASARLFQPQTNPWRVQQCKKGTADPTAPLQRVRVSVTDASLADHRANSLALNGMPRTQGADHCRSVALCGPALRFVPAVPAVATRSPPTTSLPMASVGSDFTSPPSSPSPE